MRTLVLFESMTGNTRAIANAIAEGAARVSDVSVVACCGLAAGKLSEAELLILGSPTHVRSMPWARSRQAVIRAWRRVAPREHIAVEPTAGATGVRELLHQHPVLPPLVTAFDTRVRAPGLLTGRASHVIARRLRRSGAQVVYPPASFVVRRDDRLVKGEIARAREWGERVALRARNARPAPATAS